MNRPSDPFSSSELTPEEIYRMIREIAYYKAEARNFAPGVELKDWLEAEQEVWQRLQAATGPDTKKLAEP